MENLMIKENDFQLQEYKEKFLDYIDVSDKTIDTYKIAIEQFYIYLKDNNITKPERSDIINYREYLKEEHKPTTVNSYLIAVRNFFKFLNYEGIYKDITENVKGVKLEQIHLKNGLSEEDIKKVLDVCKNNKEVLLVKLMIGCALRCNEVVNIRLQDFYKDSGITMLKILGKARDGYKQDSVKIDDRLLQLIKEYVKEYNIKDYLFVSSSNNNNGNKITTKTVRSTIKSLFEKAGLDNLDMLSAHSLRHSSCELALKSGLSIQEVSENMRHKSIQTTLVYQKELDKKESLFANNLCDALF